MRQKRSRTVYESLGNRSFPIALEKVSARAHDKQVKVSLSREALSMQFLRADGIQIL
jgi:hypothetical protein